MVFLWVRAITARTILVPIACVVSFLFLSEGGVQAESYDIHRHISYSFTIQNRTGRIIHDAQFRTYAPVKATATHRCTEIAASHPFERFDDELGNQVLQFTFQQFSPFAVKIITISADLLISPEPLREKVSDVERYLRAEQYVEADDPRIINRAKSLSRGGLLPTAEGIARWVSENIRPSGYLSGSRGAAWTLQQGLGDCTEYMYLFVALCRANRIPARCLEGFICRENAVLHPGGYHNWAEIYHDKTWKIADPSNSIFLQHQDHYIVMRIMNASQGNSIASFHRYSLVGEGLKVTMN